MAEEGSEYSCLARIQVPFKSFSTMMFIGNRASKDIQSIVPSFSHGIHKLSGESGLFSEYHFLDPTTRSLPYTPCHSTPFIHNCQTTAVRGPAGEVILDCFSIETETQRKWKKWRWRRGRGLPPRHLLSGGVLCSAGDKNQMQH